MAINYPTTLDTLTNPTGNDRVDTVDHAGQHADANDALEALEAKVGANSSAVTSSHDYKLSGVADGDKAISENGVQTIADKNIDADANTITNIGDEEVKAGIDAIKLADGSVSNAEYQTLNGVTSAIQTQIDTKSAITSVVLNTATSIAGKSWVVDEDDMSSNLATKLPTQQSVKAYVDSVASGILLPTVRTYTADATWTKPTGLQYITVEMVGGGGNGASVTATRAGGGGGSGSYSYKVLLASELDATETVTVGAVSGTSSFTNNGTTVQTTGGASVSANTETGGIGGSATGGDINIDGQLGGNGLSLNRLLSGSGASNKFGIGGPSPVPVGDTGGSVNGINGVGYGAGGSGAARGDSGTGTGGSGSIGVIIVTEYSI